MPKDEDILQLVSSHPSVNIASALKNVHIFQFNASHRYISTETVCSFNAGAVLFFRLGDLSRLVFFNFDIS